MTRVSARHIIGGIRLEEYIFWLRDIKQSHRPMVGGKGANLGDLYRGLKVPQGFCLSAMAYRRQSLLSGWWPQIEKYLEEVDLNVYQTIEKASENITQLIVKTPLLPEIEQALIEAYQQLVQQAENPGALVVAVRSSATAEDLKEASFAGQQETFLNISGQAQTLKAVKECWASLWTPRAIHYRFNKGFGHELVRMAVIIQEMIPAEVAGVMFTANPINNSRQQILIEAVRGLGEALVSGETGGETYIIHKEGLAVLERQIADQVKGQMLPDFQIRELALAGQKIEKFYEDYQDVEWAYYRGKFYFLQARPITTLGTEQVAEPDWESLNPIQRELLVTIQERFPAPIYPIDGEVVKAYFNAQFTAMENEGYEVPEVDWGKVSKGIFPEGFIPPDIRPGLFTKVRLMLQLPQTLKINSKKHWALHQDSFNEIIAKLAKRDFATYPYEVIFRYLNDTFRQFANFVEARYRLYTLERLPRRVFRWFMAKLFAERSQEISEALLSGVPSITLEINDALEDLAQSLEKWPQVRLKLVACDPAQAWIELPNTEGGQEFLSEYDKFIQKYGDRETTMGLGGLASPTWKEAPEVVMGIIRGLLLEKGDHIQKRAVALEARRQEAEGLLKERLSRGIWKWLPVRGLINKMIDYHRNFAAFREDSHYDLTRALNTFRTLFFKLGERLVRLQIIDQPEDIMYLSYEDITKSFYDVYLHQNPDTVGYKQKVESNKKSQEQREAAWRTRKVAVLEGDQQTLQGNPASAGAITGIARVITSPADFGRLQPGEILVAPYTNPAWTPLFAAAAGMVVDAGGAASHAAIIAREYGIPAVMGIPSASSIIQDGERITVNGSTGVVVRG